ncbi:hypothetical protein OV203_31860 [Nannocystis sp. ILAH1]|uniref:hypothetical protein n=1 Tax=Nannocystis sp. ILAH1 TaxID=2996789 RepID=UPI00226F84B5|nr:hypothetical protein [Nannocystis sp. ILAH1]MCY0991778.1 hypothetical protein [Nannocystis sp. ILAH1]
MSLATLHCPGCGAAAPLVAGAAIDCRHCGRSIAVPETWRAAAEGHAAAAQVRREVEPRWQQLAVGVGTPVLAAAKALLLVLPPLATWLVQSRMVPPPTPVENFGYVAFPALLPGALLWLWATTVNAAVLRVRRDVSAHEAAGALACRSCGAPLAPEPEALATTCLYCGTDSLVRDLPASTRARDHAVRTLAEAAGVLRRRRINLGLGVALLGLGVAAMVVAAALALSLAFGV